MFKKGKFKKSSLSLLGLSVGASIVLSACSFSQVDLNNAFVLYSSNNFIASTNTPLNPTFQDAPISNAVGDTLYSLVTYETTGDYVTEELDGQFNLKERPRDRLILEGATEVQVFTDEKAMQKFLQTSSQPSASSGTEASAAMPKDHWVFYRNNPTGNGDKEKNFLNEQAGFQDALNTGTIYRFKIDTQNAWVDKDGVKKQQLSGKDFERGFETYWLSAQIRLNRNGYFLNLLGLNVNKTLNAKDSASNEMDDYTAVQKASYDINDFTNSDEWFTIYLQTAYPYTFDLLTKEGFGALPHTNQKVRNIRVGANSEQNAQPTNTTDNSPIILNDGRIDLTKTEFNRIYGAGALGQFDQDVWYAGPYLIQAYTQNTVIFKLNEVYVENVYKDFFNSNETKIPMLIFNYGSGDPETFYELFKSDQASGAAIPNSRRNEAVQLFANRGLRVTKILKIPQSNYTSYTPNPYIASGANVTINANIDKNVADFLWRWNSKNSFIIRAGIAGLINHRFLSSIALPSSNDFQLSASPYGAFDQYYENVRNSHFYGGLPRKYRDYANTSNALLDGFKTTYYNIGSDNQVTLEEIEINQTTFRQALIDSGATTANPFVFITKFVESSVSSEYRDYLNKLKEELERLAGGLLIFSINQRSGTNPTATEWFRNQSAALGFSLWGPDYNALGTWLEAAAGMHAYTFTDPTNQMSKTLEGQPGTNSHNNYYTFLLNMVIAAKLYDVKLMDSQTMANGNGAATAVTTSTSSGSEGDMPTTARMVLAPTMGWEMMKTNDKFASDRKIQTAFSAETLTALRKGEEGKNLTENKFMGWKPGVIYAKKAVEFLNYLIEKDVLDAAKVMEYITMPSKLDTNNKSIPTKVEELWLGSDAIKPGKSEEFAKWLGVFTGLELENAVFTQTVFDSDYAYLPKSERGVEEITLSLVNPKFTPRTGVVGNRFINYKLNS